MATPGHLGRVRARGTLRPRPNVDPGAIKFFPPEWHEATGPAGRIDPGDPASVLRVFEANMQAYYAMIEQIDDNMGRLDAALAAAGLAEETIVVFLSDHGELGGSHGKLGKAEPWEESIGIPLIVAGPGVPGGRLAAAPVHTEDLFATFVGLAGGRAAPAAPRVDLAPFLRGATPEPARDGVLLEFVTETRPGRGYYHERWRGIRGVRHKYTVLGDSAGARPWQLFDLDADPFEMRNLLEVPGHEALAGRMHRALADLLEASGDDFALAPAWGVAARHAVAP
jgi:arylsulfatase A-like enzyme